MSCTAVSGAAEPAAPVPKHIMRVIAIVGATATGKTALGEAVARVVGGEIVCVDSRQLFGELELGTGKPTPAERRALPHHLFDLLSLGERASAGHWARAATALCHAIDARGRTPVLVGGSGLYLQSLQHGIAAEPPHDPALRASLTEEARTLGVPALHLRLAGVDPETAARLDPADIQRVTRALEVWLASGRPLSWWRRERPGVPLPATWNAIELTLGTASLAERIAVRTRAMFERGLAEEVSGLVRAGQADALRALHAVGYDEALAMIEGRMEGAAAQAETNRRTRQLAKRQRTWFRHQIDAVRLDAALALPELVEHTLAAGRPH